MKFCLLILVVIFAINETTAVQLNMNIPSTGIYSYGGNEPFNVLVNAVDNSDRWTELIYNNVRYGTLFPDMSTNPFRQFNIMVFNGAGRGEKPYASVKFDTYKFNAFDELNVSFYKRLTNSTYGTKPHIEAKLNGTEIFNNYDGIAPEYDRNGKISDNGCFVNYKYIEYWG